jgi:hypothetical protein
MATQATYYLDAPSLSSATVIYSDVNLTTVAADGFYSDGTIVREQSSGVLLPQNSCPSCATPCGGSISASGEQGIYYLSTDLGTDTGAVIVTFDPYSVPDGVLGTFNSISYNGLSSPTYGWLQGSAGLPTYIGATGANCGVPGGSPYTLSEFEYNGTTFAPLGTTTSVTILSGQLQFTAGGPGNCVMVIPKTVASPSILDLQFIGPCAGTAFNISVSCPTTLTEFQSTSVFASDTLACAATINQSYYVAHVNGSAGVLGLYDLVFSDPNGEFKLSAGYYKTADAGANDWFQVDANGVIIAFGTCGAGSYSYTVGFGGSSEDACLPVSTGVVTGDEAIFCNSTQFDGAIFAAAATGTYYVSNGGYFMEVSVTNGNTVATVTGPCNPCTPSYAISGCGVSDSSAAGACSDAGTNPKVLYSDCPSGSLDVGCGLYWDAALTSPVLQLFVFAEANWDMSGGGIIDAYSSVQC